MKSGELERAPSTTPASCTRAWMHPERLKAGVGLAAAGMDGRGRRVPQCTHPLAPPGRTATSYGTALGYRSLREQVRVGLRFRRRHDARPDHPDARRHAGAGHRHTNAGSSRATVSSSTTPVTGTVHKPRPSTAPTSSAMPRGDDAPIRKHWSAAAGARRRRLHVAFGAAITDSGNPSPATAFPCAATRRKSMISDRRGRRLRRFSSGPGDTPPPSSTSSTGSSMSAASPRRCQPTCVSASSPATRSARTLL